MGIGRVQKERNGEREEKENDREADGRRGMEFRTDDRIARGRPGEEEVVCVCVCHWNTARCKRDSEGHTAGYQPLTIL
jgi:hypothetical protein